MSQSISNPSPYLTLHWSTASSTKQQAGDKSGVIKAIFNIILVSVVPGIAIDRFDQSTPLTHPCNLQNVIDHLSILRWPSTGSILQPPSVIKFGFLLIKRWESICITVHIKAIKALNNKSHFWPDLVFQIFLSCYQILKIIKAISGINFTPNMLLKWPLSWYHLSIFSALP